MSQAALTTANNIIHETDNYDIFKVLPYNRPVVASHVRRLAEAMQKRPHLRPAQPILVNEKYQVVDGQHRLEASRYNNQTVFYMVVEGLTVADARMLNALQRTWRILDYAYSYAASGVPAYVQFVETYEERKLPPSVIIEYLAIGNSRQRQEFRAGTIRFLDRKASNKLLDELEEIVALFPDVSGIYHLASAVRSVQSVEGYDHNRMVAKLKTVSPKIQPNRIEYIRELERIYNANTHSDGRNFVRFF